MNEDRHPCDYCGTMLDEDDCVESNIPAVSGPSRVELVMKDGTIQAMPAHDALATGVDPLSVGRKVLEDMLAD